MTHPARIIEETSPILDLLDRRLASDRDDIAAPDHVWHQALRAPIRDFLSRPGKEFRSRLTCLSYAMAGGKTEVPVELPLIVEVLHAGSLIIDDIEDGSTYRRGKPALHLAYGTPVALNAGNWLYFWAYRLIGELDLGPHVELGLYRWVSRTLVQCHEGQALDLSARLSNLEQSEVRDVVYATSALKTGALMELAAAIGAVAAGAPASRVQRLADFGRRIGVALQMLDDLGGLTSLKRCHKGHEDLVNDRPTWPWAWLAESATPAIYEELSARAREVQSGDLHPELLAEPLREHIADYGRARIREYLEQTLSSIQHEFGDNNSLHSVAAELRRLERSYE